MQVVALKPMPAARRFDPRILITFAAIAAICSVFWLGSRYPSLQSKAGADPDEALSTPLGFENHFPEPRADEKLKRVLWVAAEWGITNKQGMIFGVLLAAGLLTLVPLLPRPRRGKFAGSVQGMLIGAPLGVCVNCAAPIGQAMLKGGSSVETALAAMFASPSFNVIVLGMVITLFPWYLALLKVAMSLVMVLLVVPQLSRLADRPGWSKPTDAAPRVPGLRIFQWLDSIFGGVSKSLLTPAGDAPKGFLPALAWVLLRYARNLWTVIRLSLPLMVVAGLLGAVLVELLPWTRVRKLPRSMASSRMRRCWCWSQPSALCCRCPSLSTSSSARCFGTPVYRCTRWQHCWSRSRSTAFTLGASSVRRCPGASLRSPAPPFSRSGFSRGGLPPSSTGGTIYGPSTARRACSSRCQCPSRSPRSCRRAAPRRNSLVWLRRSPLRGELSPTRTSSSPALPSYQLRLGATGRASPAWKVPLSVSTVFRYRAPTSSCSQDRCTWVESLRVT